MADKRFRVSTHNDSGAHGIECVPAAFIGFWLLPRIYYTQKCNLFEFLYIQPYIIILILLISNLIMYKLKEYKRINLMLWVVMRDESNSNCRTFETKLALLLIIIMDGAEQLYRKTNCSIWLIDLVHAATCTITNLNLLNNWATPTNHFPFHPCRSPLIQSEYEINAHQQPHFTWMFAVSVFF